ncbi:MAG: hypothetical protein WCG47_01945 [Dermatophilaceae bacterium]
MTQARGALYEVGELVEQGQVGHRPAHSRPAASGIVPQQGPLLLLGEGLMGVTLQLGWVGQQPVQHRPGVDRGPEPTGIPSDRAAAGHGVLHPVVGRGA